MLNIQTLKYASILESFAGIGGFPDMSHSEFMRILQRMGFVKIRGTGNHFIFEHPDGRSISVPNHDRVMMSRGLILGLLKRNLHITPDQFTDFINGRNNKPKQLTLEQQDDLMSDLIILEEKYRALAEYLYSKLSPENRSAKQQELKQTKEQIAKLTATLEQ